jgi:hypothetical protein
MSFPRPGLIRSVKYVLRTPNQSEHFSSQSRRCYGRPSLSTMSDDPIKKADMSYKRSKDDKIAHCKSRNAVGRFTNFAQEHTGLKSFEFAVVTLDAGSRRWKIHQLRPRAHTSLPLVALDSGSRRHRTIHQLHQRAHNCAREFRVRIC